MTDAQPEGSLLTVEKSRLDAPFRALLNERVSSRAGALTVGSGELCILHLVRWRAEKRQVSAKYSMNNDLAISPC